MLIRDVKASNDRGELALVLHRDLTVVTGLVADEQVELADILASVVYGRADGLSGTVEIDGRVVDLAAWAVIVGEEIDHLDVFLRRSDVVPADRPGAVAGSSEPAPTPARGLAAAEADLAAAEAELERARAELIEAEAEVLTAEAASASSVSALAEPSPDPSLADEPAGGGHDDRAGELDVAREAVRAALDEAVSRRDEAEERLADATARVDSARDVLYETERALTGAAAHQESAAGVVDEIDVARLEKAVAASAEAVALAARHKEVAVAAAATAAEALGQARASVEGEAPTPEEGTDEQDKIRAAEAAMADAEAAAAAAAGAAAAVSAAAEELERARQAASGPVPAAISTADELIELDRRAEELEVDLARAEAEESLFAGFAQSNRTAEWQDPVRGRAGRAERKAAGRRSKSPEQTSTGGSAAPDPGALDEAETEARAATARAAELRAVAEAMRAGAGGDHGEIADAAEARDETLRRIAACEGELEEIAPLDDPAPIADALAAARNILTPEQLEEGQELIAAIDALVAARESVTAPTAPTWLVTAARTALEEARVEMARVEEMTRPMPVDPQDVDALERAHEIVADAEAKADRRLGGMMARRRLEKAIADERDILLKLGVPSYTAFLLRTMPLSGDSAAGHQLAEARRALEDAEAVWEELHRTEAPQGDASQHEEEEARVLARAAELLGPSRMELADTTSPSATLRSVRDLLAQTHGGEGDAARRELAELLAARSDAGPEDADPVAVAEDWLAATQRAQARRAVLIDDLQSLRLEVEVLDRRLEELTGGGGAGSADPAEIEAAEAAAAEADTAATAARSRLEGAAIAAGIPRAAAAVAADAEVLEVTVDEDAGSVAPGSDDRWVEQATAEVVEAQREIEAVRAELGAIQERRHVLTNGSGPEGHAAASERADETLNRAERVLADAEEALAGARVVAEAAAARAAAAIDELDSVAARDREKPTAEPLEQVREHEEAAAEADRLAAEAADELAAAEAAAGSAAHELEAARADLERAQGELTAARQVHDQADAAHREASSRFHEASSELEPLQAAATEARLEVDRFRFDLERLDDELRERREHEAQQAERRRAELERAGQEAAAEAARWRAEQARAEHAERQARERRDAAARQVEELEGRVRELSAARDAARSAAGATHEIVLRKAEAARSVDSVGTVPMIWLDPFADLDAPAWSELVARAEGIQVIYLTDDPRVVAWAEALDPERALLLRFGADTTGG